MWVTRRDATPDYAQVGDIAGRPDRAPPDTGHSGGMTIDIHLQLHEAHVDYLGHVTAAAHLILLEEAHAAWLSSVMDDDMPSFVLAHLEMDYRREILLADGPVAVTIRPVRIGRSSLTIEEQMLGSDGTVRTEARVVLVRWDRDGRRAIAFPDVERAIIQAQLRLG